jgi:hypothetical protein
MNIWGMSMKIVMIASVILLVGLAHIAYGAFAIWFASLSAADLTAKISQEINATGATWEAWRVSFARGGVYRVGMGLASL